MLWICVTDLNRYEILLRKSLRGILNYFIPIEMIRVCYKIRQTKENLTAPS